jgi:hypothetical protein
MRSTLLRLGLFFLIGGGACSNPPPAVDSDGGVVDAAPADATMAASDLAMPDLMPVCVRNTCPQTWQDRQVVLAPPANSTMTDGCAGPSPDVHCLWGSLHAVERGDEGRHLYAYAQWGPARIDGTDPRHPTLTRYVPLAQPIGPLTADSSALHGGSQLAVAESPDGSAVVFLEWLAGGSDALQVVRFSSTGNYTYGGGVPLGFGPGGTATVVAGRAYGYFPGGNNTISVVDGTATPPAKVGSFQPGGYYLRARALGLPSAGDAYLASWSATQDEIHVSRLAAGGLPSLSKTTTVPYKILYVDMARIGAHLYVFVVDFSSTITDTTGLRFYEIDQTTLALLPLHSGMRIPVEKTVFAMKVGGAKDAPVVALHSSKSGSYWIYGTSFLAKGCPPPGGTDIEITNPPTVSAIELLAVPQSPKGFVTFVADPANTTGNGDPLGAAYFDGTCL